MESLIDDIVRLVSQPETAIETSWLEQAMAEHPYCTLPLLLYLERNGTAGNEELLSRLAIAWPDRRVLAMRLGDGVEGFYKFYPDEADETATARPTLKRATSKMHSSTVSSPSNNSTSDKWQQHPRSHTSMSRKRPKSPTSTSTSRPPPTRQCSAKVLQNYISKGTNMPKHWKLLKT